MSDAPKATTSVVEDYLQVLHYLTRDGYPVIAARLVERLNVTPPTVTATLQRMGATDSSPMAWRSCLRPRVARWQIRSCAPR